MGYCTSYELTFSLYEEKNRSIPKILLDDLDKEINRMNVFEYSHGNSYYAVETWYEWESDMCLLSSRFPEVFFILSGKGDDSEDMWIAYFVAGKKQVCRANITYDDFDPLKLEEDPLMESSYSYE